MEQKAKRVGVLGSGTVGKVLASGFIKYEYEVMVGTRDSAKLADWHSQNSVARLGSVAQTIDFGDIIVLAIKGEIAEALVEKYSELLAGKVVLDTTNPLTEEGPQNGVLSFFTDQNESLMEKLQKKAQKAEFVKIWNSVGSEFMVDPDFEIRPTMFICGNNDHAKSVAGEILEKFGWEVEDLGQIESARVIEPLCILWCIPGFLGNGWSHAFKLLRKQA